MTVYTGLFKRPLGPVHIWYRQAPWVTRSRVCTAKCRCERTQDGLRIRLEPIAQSTFRGGLELIHLYELSF